MNTPVASHTCPKCGTELAGGLLACPGCEWLVHSERLKKLAAEAEAATHAGSLIDAISAWRNGLELLPPDSRQHQVISAKVAQLGRQIDADPRAAEKAAEQYRAGEKPEAAKWQKRGLVGTLLFVGLMILTKGKWLLLGLSKGKTLITMLFSVQLYGLVFGWQLALGIVLTTYVHEMGHVAALRRYGIAATAPMFIPGIGAVIRLKQYPTDPRQDAQVGLAGPWAGTIISILCYVVGLLLDSRMLALIGQISAAVNLFNLIPVWQLDGARGFRVLSTLQRLLVTLTAGAAWVWVSQMPVAEPLVHNWLRFLTAAIALVGVLRTAGNLALPATPHPAVPDGDRRSLIQFLALVLVLVGLGLLPLPAARVT